MKFDCYDVKDKFERIFVDIKLAVRGYKKRIHKEKINVVFVCHFPQLWKSLESIFYACVKDKCINPIIVTIPGTKKTDRIYLSTGAEEFFKGYPCKVCSGYDYKLKKWLDLRTLKPDYVFFQTPYNSNRPLEYHSKNVSKYANICFVTYGAQIMGGAVTECVTNSDYLDYVKYIFAETKDSVASYKEAVVNSKIIGKKVISVGFPRFDNFYKIKDTSLWRQKNCFHVMWMPRWNTHDGWCNFFDYKDKLLEYIEEKDNVEFIFRPHPMCFDNFIKKGEMTRQEVEDYKKRYANKENIFLDQNPDYLPNFWGSDVLVADGTSLLAEYFYTEKPIIFCHKESKDFTPLGEKISKAFYWAENWCDVERYLEMLRSGNDPLLEKRIKIKKQLFKSTSKGAGVEIKNIIKEKFYHFS